MRLDRRLYERRRGNRSDWLIDDSGWHRSLAPKSSDHLFTIRFRAAALRCRVRTLQISFIEQQRLCYGFSFPSGICKIVQEIRGGAECIRQRKLASRLSVVLSAVRCHPKLNMILSQPNRSDVGWVTKA